MNNITTIEDCLELAAGLQQGPVISLDKSDITIMHSIARQVFKGTALTDRQFLLMQQKLYTYKDQFTNLDIDFNYVIEQLRQPLRDIDRSKYIKIIDNEIKIRFPFRKTEIMLVQEIIHNDGYRHNKGTHEHFFEYNETNVLDLLDRFASKDFEIDSEILEIYEKANNIRNNPQHYLSGVFNNELKNINPKLQQYIVNKNKLHLLDNKFRYGFSYVESIKSITLEEKIASRENTTYHSRPSKETTSQIFDALWNLDRFPILIVLDNRLAENQLFETINYYRDILDSDQQSVLFREEGSESGFNQLIHDRKLNNWVDKNTKIVYINTHKLPKLLINNEWKPRTAFVFESKLDKFVNTYINFHCDLIVFREEEISPIRKYSKYYG